MKPVLDTAKHSWGAESDTKKAAFIAKMVEQKIIPKYSGCGNFMDFYHYLTNEKAFNTSGNYYRYLNTFGAITQEMGVIAGKKIVETGGASPISTFLARENDCYSTDSDLRIGIDVETSFADIVISLEVAEHIKDQPENNFNDIVLFNGSGIRCFANETHRIIKPGGSLLLTTPNCCSYRAIQNAINHEAPYIFRQHVREYNKSELVDVFKKFNVKNHLTQFNFFMLGNQSLDFDKLFNEQNWSIEDRGDDHFFHFQKQ